MRVLYVGNTVGVFSPVAKWLNENGHEAIIITRSVHDFFKHTASLDCGRIITGAAKEFYRAVICLIRSFKPDIIHVSSYFEMLTISRLFALRTRSVLTFHGSDVRNKNKTPSFAKLANFIHVSTPDLRRYGTWIERPIDNDTFYYRGGRVPGTALMYYSPHLLEDERALAIQVCKERDLQLTILDRSDPIFVPLSNIDMPAFLSKFEYLLDMKGNKGKNHALSYLALEALACGVKVVHDGDISKTLLPESGNKAGSINTYIALYENLPKDSLFLTLKRICITLSFFILLILKIPARKISRLLKQDATT